MVDSITLRFRAAVHSVTSDGKRLATFYLMNTSPNRNNWAVTGKALEEALPTLLGKPLGCIPGYRLDHVHEPMQVGRWVKTEKPDGYALATAEITDDTAWTRITSGEWGPVSVVIKAYRVTCSRCGSDITAAPDEHVLTGDAHEVVESFVFDHVDFVSEPAYPQAGIVSIDELVLGASRSKVDGQAGARGYDPKPADVNNMNEELTREVEVLRAENTGLKGTVQRLEAERREEKVQRVLEARVKAGLVRDRVKEEERLKGLEDGALTLLAEDAEQIAAKSIKAAGPKARFTAEGGDLEAAVEETRLRLFGYRREN